MIVITSKNALSYAIPFEESFPQLDKNDDEREGIKTLDKLLSPEDKQVVEQQYPGSKYLGYGDYGIAYSFGNHVVKLTTDSKEMRLAKELLKSPKEGIVNVFSIKQIKQNPPVWLIEMEKLRNINEDVYLAKCFEICYFYLQMEDEPIDSQNMPNHIWNFLSLKYDSKGTEGAKQKKIIYEQCVKNIPKVARFFALMYKYNLRLNELYITNVGLKENGEIALLDLGAGK